MTDREIVNGELRHYGVKGMTWGVRKAYYDIRSRRHRNLEDKWTKRVDKTRFKNRLNPKYGFRKKRAEIHKNKADYRESSSGILKFLMDNEREISAISGSPSKAVNNFLHNLAYRIAK